MKSNTKYGLALAGVIASYVLLVNFARSKVTHAQVKRIYTQQEKHGVGYRAVKTELPRIETDKGTFTDNMNILYNEWTVGGDSKYMVEGETYDIVTDLFGDILKAEKVTPQ